MHTFRQGPLSIFWGDKSSCSVPKDSPAFKDFCVKFAHDLGLPELVVLNQEHGIVGYQAGIGFSPGVSVYEKSGDWLITNKPGLGIGVHSADCLPVVLYDPEHNTVGVAHSGWRGTVKNIVGVMLDAMVETFKTQPAQVQVFFGPAAKTCCYEVSPSFESALPAGYDITGLLVKRDGKLFFDNALLCQRMLEKAGVRSENINQAFNLCTMCDNQFHSARRDKSMERNLTVVSIN